MAKPPKPTKPPTKPPRLRPERRPCELRETAADDTPEAALRELDAPDAPDAPDMPDARKAHPARLGPTRKAARDA